MRIVLTFFVLEDVRVLLVNDDATVAGFSATERKRGFLLFKPFIRYRSLELERFPLFPILFSLPPSTARYSLFSLSFLVRRRRELILEINGGLGHLNENRRLDELRNSRDRTERSSELTRPRGERNLFFVCACTVF